MIRVGIGWDLHQLAPERPFILGGIRIPATAGELGHSDGDALTHAVIDAVLGAAALGDIGELFPPGDPAWKDAASLGLLAIAWDRCRAAGWHLVNLDCVVICDEPKILPWRNAIRKSLGGVLQAPMEQIFLKGKTWEGTANGSIAVEAHGVALLERAD